MPPFPPLSDPPRAPRRGRVFGSVRGSVFGCWAAVALLSLAACSGNDLAASRDAGGDSAGLDSPPDYGPAITFCSIAPTVCDGLIVRACVDGTAGPAMVTCAEACSFGRCTSAACSSAEKKEGLRGCLFYGAQVDNIDSDDAHTLMLAVGNPGGESASVQVEWRATAGGAWTPGAAAVMRSNGGARLQLSRPVRAAGVTGGGGFRVVSDRPISVVQIVSDDSDRTSRSSGGTMLRPVQALGTEHMVLTFPAHDTDEVRRNAGSRAGAGAIAVVATADRTQVRLALSAAALVAPGVIVGPAPAAHTVTLDEGDVLQVFAVDPSADLTGSTIDADARVAVFSGNVFTTYDFDSLGFAGGDLAVEQMPPVPTWGDRYVGAWLSPQSECDPFFGAGVGLWRVVAARDDTRVTLKPGAEASIDLPALTFTLGRGQVQSFLVRAAPTSRAPAPVPDFLAEATGPILVAQWLDCEPGLALGIDTRLNSLPLAFTLPPGFEHELMVVRDPNSDVYLDGRLIPSARFTSWLDGGAYQVARIPAAELGRCIDLSDPCEHTLTGAKYGAAWRGMDVVCSYSLTVPAGDACAIPQLVCPG